MTKENYAGVEPPDKKACNDENPSQTFCPGTRVIAIAKFDEQPHQAEVIEVNTADEEPSYYIHYTELNKRLDEWVAASRVSLAPVAKTPPHGSILHTLPVSAQVPLVSPSSLCLPGDATNPALPLSHSSGTVDLLTGKVTRSLKRRHEMIHNTERPMEDMTPIDQSFEKEHEEKTKVKNVQVLEMGRWEVDTWYFSPFPAEYASLHKLYVCEFCLKYMKKEKTLIRHQHKCPRTHPPGKLIYSDNRSTATPLPPTTTRVGRSSSEGALSPTCSTSAPASKGPLPDLHVFEVDGATSKVYCQNLCLLAKLFLDHKTLYFDVEPFLFYVVTEVDSFGEHVVGYFSKEKHSLEDFNLACILTLPQYQRKGYGRFLIALSYELSRREGHIGTPERPLSDLGQVSYRSYWTHVLLMALRATHCDASIKSLSEITFIRQEDIIATLKNLNMIAYVKNEHLLKTTPKIIEQHCKSISSEAPSAFVPEKLTWTPPAKLPLNTKI